MKKDRFFLYNINYLRPKKAPKSAEVVSLEWPPSNVHPYEGLKVLILIASHYFILWCSQHQLLSSSSFSVNRRKKEDAKVWGGKI